jgi:hypothetical protein
MYEYQANYRYEYQAHYRYEYQAHYRTLDYQTEAYKFRPIEYREKYQWRLCSILIKKDSGFGANKEP